MQWTYLVERANALTDEEKGKFSDRLSSKLNSLGEEGWELVCVNTIPNCSDESLQEVYIFKRTS